MIKKFHLLFAVASVFMFSSCESESTENPKEHLYSYKPESSVLEWTAFKFTERAGVKGTFNEITISGIDSSTDPKKLIESLGFTIPVVTVETNDPERNANIATYFFKSINTDVLKGQMIELKENGDAIFELTMNSITKKVIGNYKLTDQLFALNAEIDLLDWNSKTGIDALNRQCELNHTGTDGILKLWSEVEISFTTNLSKTEKK